jgi:HD-GYP domain-containing protein (c-di-GMP phosphodiesterase class II)
VRREKERFIGFILGGEIKGRDMAKSSVNSAILSFLIALELKLPHHKILNIIIAALLHDTGMLRLPPEIIEKKGGLSEPERKLMCSHPLISHKIATKELNFSDEIGTIVLQHHERWDGTGYPLHIAGEKIITGARILSIVDSFEAMVCQKPYRNSMVGNKAMKNLLADNSRYFDPDILKTFILTMGIYPIGSIVSLNNGILGRVTETLPDAPLRPKIQVLIDEFKNVFKNEEGFFIDLLNEKNLFIIKALNFNEFSELNSGF